MTEQSRIKTKIRPGQALGKALAIAGHTFREATRRKVFLAAIVFSLAVAALSWFLPAYDYASKVKLVASICLSTSAFFATLVAVVIAATSIPKDLDQKLVYTVLTKPVSRVVFFWGKLLGYLYVVALILGIMWIVTIGVMRAIATRGNLMATVVEPSGRAEKAGLQEGDVIVSCNGAGVADLQAFVSIARAAEPGATVRLTVLREGKDREIDIKASGPEEATEVLASPLSAKLGFDAAEVKLSADRSIAPSKLVFHGFEDMGIQKQGESVWMSDEGAGPNSVEVLFSKIPLHSLPQGDVRVAIKLEMTTSHVGRFVDNVPIGILNPQTGEEEFFNHRLKGRTLSVLYVSRRHLSADGSLILRLVRENPSAAFGIAPDSFRLLLSPRSFELNVLRSYVVLFLQMFIIVAVASFGSTFLSGAVAMFASFGVYVCGSVMDFMAVVAQKLKEGTYHMPGHTHGWEDLSQFGRQWYDNYAYYLVRAFMTVFPDFRKFENVRAIIDGSVIPWHTVANALLYALVYGAVCVAAGSIIFWRREVD